MACFAFGNLSSTADKNAADISLATELISSQFPHFVISLLANYPTVEASLPSSTSITACFAAFAISMLVMINIFKFDKNEILVGLESKGIYSENLICFLYEAGYKLAVINPSQTATLRKTAIRKTKTDKVDTLLIIKSLMVNSYRLYSQRDAESLKPKTLCRFRQNLKKSKARLINQLAGYVNLVFPEYAKFFRSGIHVAISYALLKKCSTPKEIAPVALVCATSCCCLTHIKIVQSPLESVTWTFQKRYRRSVKKSGDLLCWCAEHLHIYPNSSYYCTK